MTAMKDNETEAAGLYVHSITPTYVDVLYSLYSVVFLKISNFIE